MTDLTHHYKDREPEETIQIIEKFFSNRNIEIIELTQHFSQAKTYSCSCALYWNNKKILSCNGKGMTYIYSKASCYAELYERFCLYASFSNSNKFIQKDIKNKNKEKFNYYFNKDEKQATYLDLLNEPYSNKILSLFLPTMNKDFIEQYMDMFLGDENRILIPYTGLVDNKYHYKNNYLITTFYGTTGFAAGNTYEEAIVQASSEFFERYTIELFYSKKQEKYYYLNKDTLNPVLKTCIENIEKNNMTARIYDLSYNFNMPVCVLVIFDKTNNVFYLDFGSSPIFDIAAERCITEMYQGCSVIPFSSKILTRPSEISWQEACKDAFHSSVAHDKIIIPENLIINGEEIDHYNNNIFLSSQLYNNSDLIEQIKKIDIQNDLKLCWTDISLSNDMKAIQIISEEIKITSPEYIFKNIYSNTSNKKINIINATYFLINGFTKIFNNEKISEDEVEKFIINFSNLLDKIDDNNIQNRFHSVLYYLNMDVYNIFDCMHYEELDDYDLFFNIVSQNFNNIVIDSNMGLKNIFQAYMILFGYLKDNYSKDTIKKIYNQINFDIDIDNIKKEDITPLFLIKKIFVDYIQDIINSKNYKQFINLFIKN